MAANDGGTGRKMFEGARQSEEVTRDEKLREVLRGLAVGLSAEKGEVALGDSGSSLRLEIKKELEHAWLELLDVDGSILTSEGYT